MGKDMGIDEAKEVYTLYMCVDEELKHLHKRLKSSKSTKSSKEVPTPITDQDIEIVVQSLEHRVKAMKNRQKLTDIIKNQRLPEILLKAITDHKKHILKEIKYIKENFSSLQTREEETRKLLVNLMGFLNYFQKRIHKSLDHKYKIIIDKTDETGDRKKK